MHAHTSCFALAEGYFRLNPQSLRGASSQKDHGRGREVRAWLDLVMRSTQGRSFCQRNRQLVSGVLLALLLHMLCFGLIMAHAHFAGLEKMSGISAQEGTNQTSGILIGQIFLSAVKSHGQAPPVAAARAEASEPEAPVPKAPESQKSEPEKTLPAVAEENSVPAIPLQGARPVSAKQPKPARSAKAEASTAAKSKEPAAAAAGTGKKPERDSSNPVAAVVESSGTGDAGTGGSGASGGLTPFGGSNGPSFKHLVKPEYPAQARRQGISGQVLLCINLSAKGSVERVEVVKSAHELLSKAALEAVGRSSFHPLRRDGKPVACSTLLPISFNLERG